MYIVLPYYAIIFTADYCLKKYIYFVGLLTCVEQAVLSLVSVFHKLPLSLGITLHTHVQYEAVKAVQAVKNLLKVIKDEGAEAV